MATLNHQVKGNELKYESPNGHLEERINSWSYVLGTQITSMQGFGASNFHIWHLTLGR